MTNSIQTIDFANLLVAFLPVAAVLLIFIKWNLTTGNTLYALSRMLGQLLLIGYVLGFIFESNSALVVLLVLTVMVLASSWIALRTIHARRRKLYGKALIAITLGGGFTLALVSHGVLDLNPWFYPRYLIPLAGMIFANAMNSVSLAADRMIAEIGRKVPYDQARNIAFQTSLIPIVNSLFAVGLVSLPGMMTGQILSGISPLIAARYQIMVMCMVFSAAGLASACFLHLTKNDFHLSPANINNPKDKP